MASGVTLDDFIDGIAAGLSLQGCSEVRNDDLDSKLVTAFNVLEEFGENEFEIRFHLAINPFTLTSASGMVALERASSRGVLGREKRHWNILLSKEEANKIINRLPLTAKQWNQISCKVK